MATAEARSAHCPFLEKKLCSCKLWGNFADPSEFPSLPHKSIWGGAWQHVSLLSLPPSHCLLVQALEARDVAALKDAFMAYDAAFEAHMVVEEDVMMPLTMKVGSTPAERAKVCMGYVSQLHRTYECR